MRLAQTAAPSRRRGGTLVLVALCLIVIVAVLALALDGGALFAQGEQGQATASAAALAAAADLAQNYITEQGTDTGGTARASALAVAKSNGYNNDGSTSVVTISISPQNYQQGPNAGKPLPPGYVEVIVQYNQPRSFSAIWGSGTLPVQARAVARGQFLPSVVGVVSLNPTASGAVSVVGTLNLPTGGQIHCNSNHPSACSITGTGNLTCGGIHVCGGLQNSGKCNYTNGGSCQTGCKPDNDPLTNLPAHTPTGTPITSCNMSGNCSISPGTYNCPINLAAGCNCVMQPGIYHLTSASGISCGKGCTINGAGVCIYNESGDNLDFSQCGGVTITPPSSGTYQGVCLFHSRSDSSTLHIQCGANFTMWGTCYHKSGCLDFRPNGPSTSFNLGSCVSDTVSGCTGYNQSSNQSNGQLNLNCTTGAPITRCHQLVECGSGN